MEWAIFASVILTYGLSFLYGVLALYEKPAPVVPEQLARMRRELHEFMMNRAAGMAAGIERMIREQQQRRRKIDFDWKKEGF